MGLNQTWWIWIFNQLNKYLIWWFKRPKLVAGEELQLRESFSEIFQFQIEHILTLRFFFCRSRYCFCRHFSWSSILSSILSSIISFLYSERSYTGPFSLDYYSLVWYNLAQVLSKLLTFIFISNKNIVLVK